MRCPAWSLLWSYHPRMDLQSRRRDDLSSVTARLVRLFGIRSGRFVTALQVPFSGIYLPLLVALALSSEIVRPGLAWAGAVVVVAASGWARLSQRAQRTAAWVPALLCASCFAAVGLLTGALGTHGYLVTIIALLPSTWLAYAYLWRGALVGVAATGVLMVVAGVVDTGGQLPLGGVFYAVLPLVTLAMTSACVLVTESWEVQRSRQQAEQTRLDDALSERSKTAVLLEAMLDSLDSSVVAFDTKGQTLLSNASHLYPLSWAGPVGSSARLIFEADATTPVPSEKYPSELAKRGITVDERLMWFGTPGPDQRAVLATSRPMTGSDGTVHGVMAIYHDITTMMRAMQVKDDFVETVSHELRTPLTSILGYLELIRDDHDDAVNVLPEETLEYLLVISRNAGHLLDLVSDLLSTATSAADALKITRTRVDLGALVGRAVESAQPAFDAQGIRLACSLEPMPELLLDRRRFSQVIDNLLSNSLKYTERGGHVVITTHRSGSGVVMTVTDTGIGISPEDLGRIFEKFNRARSATALHIPGIGLGLSITKAIVDAHQGTITVASRPREGTSVTVRLPIEDHPTEPDDYPTSAPTA